MHFDQCSVQPSTLNLPNVNCQQSFSYPMLACDHGAAKMDPPAVNGQLGSRHTHIIRTLYSTVSAASSPIIYFSHTIPASAYRRQLQLQLQPANRVEVSNAGTAHFHFTSLPLREIQIPNANLPKSKPHLAGAIGRRPARGLTSVPRHLEACLG